MVSSISYSMAVPLVFFLFFYPTTFAEESLLYRLTGKTHLIDALCFDETIPNGTLCAQIVRQLKLQTPTTQKDLVQLGLILSNFTKKKARDTLSYIGRLTKQYSNLNSTLHDCRVSYNELIKAYGVIDTEFTSNNEYDTIDYDLFIADHDNFHCSDDQFIKQGLHESPMAAKNDKIQTLSNMISRVGILLQLLVGNGSSGSRI